MRSRVRGRSSRIRAAAAVAMVASVFAVAACGGDESSRTGGSGGTTASGPTDGIKQPIELKRFKPGPAGEKPDLPKRLAWAGDNDREYSQAIKSGLEAAANDNGLDFVSALADDDAAKNVQQIQQFLAEGIGALAVIPIDAAAQAPLLREAIDKGISVQGILLHPADTQLNANQYAIGNTIATDAATYITEELGGEANVVIFNQDTIEPLQPRFKGMRDAIAKVPGAKIVADVEPPSTDKDGAFRTMNSVLQKNPRVDVVLGADAVVLGALAALEAAHKVTPKLYLGGIDGEPEALAKIREGGPYKATVGIAPAIHAYAMGQNAADWLKGKPIPQAIDVKPVLLDSSSAIDAYEKDQKDPGAAYKDPKRRAAYLELLGSISYATRGSFLDYPWAP